MPRYIVNLKDNVDLKPIKGRPEEVKGALKESSNRANEKARNKLASRKFRNLKVEKKFWIANSLVVDTEDESLIAELRKDDDVASIEQEATYKPLVIEEEPDLSTQTVGDRIWGVDYVQAHEVWSQFNIHGNGARIAVCDTGVSHTHSSLSGKLYTINPSDSQFPGGWARISFTTGNMVSSSPSDGDGHGTHVSGTVLGNNFGGFHIGVAPQATLFGVGVLDASGFGNDTSVMGGMEWCGEPRTLAGVATNTLPHAANFSLGVAAIRPHMSMAVRALEALGVLVVVSSGNGGTNSTSSPGNSWEAFSVGAHEKNSNVTDFSTGRIENRNNHPGAPSDWPRFWRVPVISAPGRQIRSAWPGGGFATGSGTSMAAPHVAGIAALLKEAKPDITVDEMKEAITGASTWDERHRMKPHYDIRLGYGRVNALEAVRSVL